MFRFFKIALCLIGKTDTAVCLNFCPTAVTRWGRNSPLFKRFQNGEKRAHCCRIVPGLEVQLSQAIPHTYLFRTDGYNPFIGLQSFPKTILIFIELSELPMVFSSKGHNPCKCFERTDRKFNLARIAFNVAEVARDVAEVGMALTVVRI